ncbi:kinase-like domain-containing protein [Phlebopus sp. FC_14]|nr:kinase-like domain-containing protein [Phlebopus sp. FC_14]
MLVSTTNTFGGVEVDSESDGEDQDKDRALHPSPQQPQISATSSSSSQTLLPSSPSPHLLAFSQQHLSPSRPGIHPFISSLKSYLSPIDPIPYFTDLVEIAEGESGSVYAARVSASAMPEIRSAGEREIQAGTSHVAIKRIILPSSPTLDPASTSTDDSPLVSKVSSLLHELTLLKGIEHEHLLLLDAVYATSNDADTAGQASTAVDSSLWIRMELMERSLADVIGLVSEGLALQERMVGRFASDVLLGLEYLQKQHVAHRDVRSDNLLLNAGGIVKIADFSNAIRVTRNAPMVTGAVGVMYWQAPEMRAGPYNALKVDVWSLGATVWELAETVPPFSMPASPSTHTTFALARHPGSQWPPLSHPEHYSKAFHEFLRHCGRDPNGRPGPAELLNTPLIRNACGRAVILQLLSQCRSIEESMIARENSDRDS